MPLRIVSLSMVGIIMSSLRWDSLFWVHIRCLVLVTGLAALVLSPRPVAAATQNQNLPDENTTVLIAQVSELNRNFRFNEAVVLGERIITSLKARLGPNHPGYANALFNVATLFDLAGKHDDAKARYREVRNIYSALVKREPDNEQWQRGIIRTCGRLLRLGDDPGANVETALATVKRIEAQKKLQPWERRWPAELEAGLRQMAVDSYFEAGRYADALAMARLWGKAVKHINEPQGTYHATVRAYDITASIALFASEPEAALSVSEKALALAPHDLWAALNRAHALMFLGRADAARAAYQQHAGEIIPNFGPWEAVIGIDYGGFRKHGIIHPQMAEIERLAAKTAKPGLVTAVWKEAKNLIWQKRVGDLEAWLQHYPDTVKARYGENSVEYADALDGVAAFGAKEYADSAFKIYTKLLPPNAPRVVAASLKKAYRLENAGRHADSEVILLRLIEYCDNTPRTDNGVAELLYNSVNALDQLYGVTDRNAEKKGIWRAALQIAERKWGVDHPYVALFLKGASFGLSLAESQKARERVRKIYAKELQSPKLRINSGPLLHRLNMELSSLLREYQRQGRLAEAESGYRLLIRNPREQRMEFNNLIALYKAQGKYAEADAGYEWLIRDMEKHLLANLQSPLYARYLKEDAEAHLEAAGYYRGRKNESKAAVHEARGLALLQSALYQHSRVPLEMTGILGEISKFYVGHQQYGNARAAQQRAIAIRERLWTTASPTSKELRAKLALLRKHDVPAKETAPQARKSLNCGAFETDVLADLDNWPAKKAAYQLRCTPEEWSNLDHFAAPLFPESKASRAKRLYPIAEAYAKRGDWANAMALYGRAAEIAQPLIQRASRFPAKIQKDLQWRRLHEGAWEYVVSAYNLALQDKKRAAELRGKAFIMAQRIDVSTAALAFTQMVARKAKGDSRLARLLRERQGLMDEWVTLDIALTNAMIVGKPRDLAAERRQAQKAKAIDTRIAEIDKRLAVEAPDYTMLTRPAPLTIGRVQELLQPDQAFVQFLHVPQNGSDLVYVWTITKSEVRWHRVDLRQMKFDFDLPFTPTFLSDVVRMFRCGMDSSTWAGGGMGHRFCQIRQKRAAEIRARQSATEVAKKHTAVTVKPAREWFDPALAYRLYKILFGPADDLIRDKELLIVPSGPLAQLPFHTLITAPPDPKLSGTAAYAKARWLIRRQPVTILPSASSFDLARRMKSSPAPKALIGFGNPLLQGQPGNAGQMAQARSARKKQSCRSVSLMANAERRRKFLANLPLVGVFFRGNLADVTALKAAPPLPETADELCTVAQNLGVPQSDIWLGKRMTETAIKELSEKGELRNYRVIHFATHGLVAGDLEGVSEPALMFTPPDTASERDDGLLTSSEVAQLELNADWVVMSACNTAAGNARNANALSGLARAFFYSGARSLLVSHWSVNSEVAVAITTRTFRETAQGVNRSEALRRAMLAEIEKEKMYSHPAMWAAFALVGVQKRD